MARPALPKRERDFYSVVKFSSALSIGLMAAFIYSVKQVNPTLRIEVGFGAVVIFAISAFVVWQILRGVFGETPRASQSEATRRRWFITMGTLLTLGTVGGFIFAMRNVSSPEKMEVLQGTLFAFFVLGLVGVALIKLMRFLEDESDKETEPHDHEDPK